MAQPSRQQRPSGRESEVAVRRLTSREDPAAAPSSPPTGEEGAPSLGKLRRLAAGGAGWTVGAFVIANGLRLVGNVILAHLLFPEAFGLMAIVHACIQGLWLVSDLGIGPNIVQNRRGDEQAFLHTAWTIQLLRAALLFGVALALAGPVASFYARADPTANMLTWLIPVAALTVLVDGASSTALHSHERHLNLGRLLALQLGIQVASLLAMVTWALMWPTVWALVVGALLGSALRTWLSHALLGGGTHRLAWDPSAARAIFRFGSWVFLSTLFTFAASQVDRLTLGRLTSLEVLGVYGIAVALASMAPTAVMRLSRTVAFPFLSRLLQEHPSRFSGALGRCRVPILLGSGAMVVALAVAGPALIATLYDSRYADAGWMLQILLAGAWFRCAVATELAALLAMGRPQDLAGLNAVRVATLGAGLGLGFHSLGLPGALVGLAVGEALTSAVTLTLSHARGLRLDWALPGATLLLLLSLGLGLLCARALAAAGWPLPGAAAGACVASGAPWALLLIVWWRRTGRAGWQSDGD